jgi:hypothetical protein
MKPYGTYVKGKYAVYIYGIVLISAVIPALLAVKHIRISPDSMIYSLVSQEILSGNGIRLPIIYDMKDHIDFTGGSVPYLGEPPLLPMLFAMLGGVTPQSYLAAQIINVFSHVIISIFTFLLMKKLYDNNVIALLAGVLVSVSIPLLKLTHYILSDTLCIAFTIVAIYFLTLPRHYDRYQVDRNLYIASICTSAAVLTRFAGVALIPAFLWGTFVLKSNKNIKLSSLSTVLSSALPVITIGALFTITYIISGSIHGWNPPPPDRSYFSAFTATLKMIFLQFDLGERPVALLSIFSILLILYIFLNSSVRKEISKYVQSGLDVIIVFFFSHTLLITYAMAKSQTVFELRYMSPLVPFLFILSIIIIAVAGKIIKTRGESKLSLCVVILSLGAITFGNCYKTYMNSGMFSAKSKQEGHYRILNSLTYNWIRENYKNNVIITTNRSFHLSFFGGYSTIRLPHKRFNKNSRIPDNMESFLPDRMSKFGSRVLALFEEAEEQYEGRYIAGLFNKREDKDNFDLIQDFSDGVVYTLKE